METSNINKKWILNDDILLKKLVIEDKTYDEIEIILQRNKSSILTRVIDKIIFPEYNSENINLLSEKYKIDINYLQKCMTYNLKIKEYYNKKREEIKIISGEKYNELLNDIIQRLERIEKKLDC